MCVENRTFSHKIFYFSMSSFQFIFSRNGNICFLFEGRCELSHLISFFKVS